jgi:hypothetical protein
MNRHRRGTAHGTFATRGGSPASKVRCCNGLELLPVGHPDVLDLQVGLRGNDLARARSDVALSCATPRYGIARSVLPPVVPLNQSSPAPLSDQRAA